MWQVDIFGLPDRANDSRMAGPQLREEEGGGVNGIITVSEYIAWRQPGISVILENWRWVEQHSLLWWARLMTERPLPGRAGLLKGEKAV